MNEPKHFPWIDWLRFLAAVFVLMEHAREVFLVRYGLLPVEQKILPVAGFYALTRLGHVAVIVFFVLSGYLVAGKAISRMCSNEFKTGDYALDRFVRIYLPYLPTLALTSVCTLILGGHPTITNALVNLFSLQRVFGEALWGNNPLWTIAYEVWFYILVGSLGGFIQFKDQSRWRTALAVICLFLSAAIFTRLSSTYLFCWLLGALAYFYHQRSRSVFALSVLLSIYSIIGMLVCSESISVDTTQWAACFPSSAILILLLAASVAIGISQIVQYHPVTPLVQRVERTGTLLAAFSYTLYLTHDPLLSVIETYLYPRGTELSVTAFANMFVACCLVILVSLGMYLLFERNTVRFKRWLRQRFTENPNRSM